MIILAGFILAAAGSAVGLGNIWKLPNEVQSHGGGLFVLLYLLSVVVIGLPALLSEVLIGKHTERSPIKAFTLLGRGSFWGVCGAIGVVAGIVILSFYSVVGGWTIHYAFIGLFHSIGIDLPYGIPYTENIVDFEQGFDALLADSQYNLLLHAIFMCMTVLVIRAGVNRGIEKISRILMVLLFIIVLSFALYACTLPTAGSALSYLFTPRFDLFSADTVVRAIGQSFFP